MGVMGLWYGGNGPVMWEGSLYRKDFLVRRKNTFQYLPVLVILCYRKH